MTSEVATNYRLRRALEWERTVVIFSFCICLALFLGPGVLLGRFVAPAILKARPTDLGWLIHLSVAAFLGLVCMGTIIIAANLLYGVAIDLARRKSSRG